eukprot:11157222-Lingulodinium_polyedra.AAC.1
MKQALRHAKAGHDRCNTISRPIHSVGQLPHEAGKGRCEIYKEHANTLRGGLGIGPDGPDQMLRCVSAPGVYSPALSGPGGGSDERENGCAGSHESLRHPDFQSKHRGDCCILQHCLCPCRGGQ